ncbi:MAG TPA: T9SS type A sorting domain-containing protein, partial [Ignavibacteriales bacterium]|nr:T9SS type A sorting domain-containing protein [Ignavibacteriales bacterium]
AVTEKGRDYFVAGPSGIGYAFPENFKNMETFASRTNDFMKKADLSILNILANNDSDDYLSPFLKQPDIDAIFFYFYSNYSGGAGKIKWTEGKPVIYGRYNFWDGVENASSLAGKLNSASRNKYSADGYSLIPVHVWSRSVSDVLECAALLDSNVVVVTPDVFVSLIKKNLAPLDEALCITPNGEAPELPFLVEGFTGTAHDTLIRWADANDKIIYRFNKADLLSKTGSADNLQISFTVSNEYMVYTSTGLNGPWEEVARWSVDTTKHNHLPSNKREWRAGLSEYFNAGAENVYLKFEDGIKADAYGPKVYNICIKKPRPVIGIDGKEKSELPKDFKLGQNYPNPFNPETLISYNLSSPGSVTLNIYDALGRQVASLVNSYQQSGAHTIRWDGMNSMGQKVSSGVYLYRLSCNGFAETKKMVMLR